MTEQKPQGFFAHRHTASQIREKITQVTAITQIPHIRAEPAQ